MARTRSCTSFGSTVGRSVVAAPAALVGRDLGKAGDVGHDRADQRAVAGGAALDRARHVVDVAHDLEFFVGHAVGVLVPVGLGPDEEGGAPGIAVGRLHHQMVAQLVLLRAARAARRSPWHGRARWARWARRHRCRAGWSRSWNRCACAAWPAAAPSPGPARLPAPRWSRRT